MHVGALVTFEGPPPAREDFIEQLESRLRLIPRYRQKLAFPPFELGRPFWVDDPSFNLDYHVRHTALPRPGSDEQLRELAGPHLLPAARSLEAALGAVDHPGARAEPLRADLEDPPRAGGRRLGRGHRDRALRPLPRAARGGAGGQRGCPRRSRRRWTCAAEGVRGLVRTPIEVAGRALGALGRPGRSVEQLREAAEGIGEIVWAGLNPAPDVPLNVPIGPHRRVWWVESRLADFKAIKDALGGTVNDVVLAVVAGALGRWLRSRGVRTEGLELRALVPVSIRSDDERGSLGNRIAAMRGPLPVYAEEPVERLRLVRAGMSDLKESKQALGAEVIAGLTGFAPPTLLAQASRLNFSTRLFNLIVTNVPGPQFPLYLLGREMESIVPIAFLPENHALAIAIMSYNGKLHFGLLGDYDAMSDLEALRRPPRGRPRRAAPRGLQVRGEGERGRQRRPQVLARAQGHREPAQVRKRAQARRSAARPCRHGAPPRGGAPARASRSSSSAATSSRPPAYSPSSASRTCSHVRPGHLAGHVAGGGRGPVEPERLVDRDEHVADTGGALDHDHAAHVGGAADQPLADARELELAARAQAVGARAVLPRHLAHPRVHPESREGAGQQAGGGLEAPVDAAPRRGLGHRVGDRDRALVKYRGAAARQAQHGVEAAAPRGGHRLRVAGRDRVLLAERHHGPRPRDAKRLGQLARGHPLKKRAPDRDLEHGVSDVRPAYDVEPAQPGPRLNSRGRTSRPRSSCRVSRRA